VEYKAETDGMECYGEEPWKHYITKGMGKYDVPVVKQELRLISEVSRKREERVESLIDHIKEIEGDLELLKRGFSERKISEEIQKGIFDKINE